ncbi:MAG: hypothetical protein A4E60_00238 [Syntrophorhabdus sp. PtaB.Bin047]|jgi:hypothetical protein|nr:MAG: hypothetical protein A4E60_00238 [Syntrophorhabdus sp. PtaB.Bin047]
MTITIDAAARIRRMRNATVSIQRLRTTEDVTSYETVQSGVSCIIIPQKRYSQQDEDAIYREKGGESTLYNLYFVSTVDVKPGDIVNDGTLNFRLLNDFERYVCPGFIIAPAVIES